MSAAMTLAEAPAKSMLETLLSPGALTTLFQPIVEVDDSEHRIHAFECLTRGPRDTNFYSADVLFEYARRKGAEAILDRACAAQAIVTAAGTLDADITINVHASTLGRDLTFARDLGVLARARSFDPERIIIEIVEHSPALNRRDFITSLATLRAAGMRIALDDVGVGYSNFLMMVDCAPDYLKIERHFIHRADSDPRRAAVVESVVSFASRVGARVVAEGVEDEGDRAFLARVGVELLQGYFFARPMSLSDASRFTL